MHDRFDVQILDPSLVIFTRGPGGMLQAEVNGLLYAEVVLSRTFPLSRPTKYLSLGDSDGQEIGIILDLAQLDKSSQLEAETELKLRYLLPVVTRIDRIKQDPGLWIWDLQTDRGSMRIIMRNLHDHMQIPEPGRLLISDLDGRRCEIPSTAQLDTHSLKELSKIM